MADSREEIARFERWNDRAARLSKAASLPGRSSESFVPYATQPAFLPGPSLNSSNTKF